MKSKLIVRRFMVWSSLIFGILISYGANAQIPAVSWETRLGGPYTDGFNAIAQTQDGGYVATGIYNGGSLNGNYDYWIQKINGNGEAAWSKTYGGTAQDQANAIIQTDDGGYMVGGTAMSIDGDVTGAHGGNDAWILKLDSFGNVIWKRCYGGSSFESLSKILKLPDNTFMILGSTSSDDGDLTGINTVNFFGEGNIWLMKIGADGAILWQKTYGGSGSDAAFDIIAMPDGGFTLSGTEATPTGMFDLWVCRTDSLGHIDWESVFGYGDYDEAYALAATDDDNILIAGHTLSTEFPEFNGGGSDAIIAKLDGATGDFIWHKAIGGSRSEWITSITAHNGLYILAGTSNSSDGAISTPLGEWDIWLVAIDNMGNIQWDKNFGGGGTEAGSAYPVSIIPTTDNGLVVASMTGSDEISGGGGLWDGYVFKLKNNALGIRESKLSGISIYPNPASNYLHIRVNETGAYKYKLIDVAGSVLKSGSFITPGENISMETIPAGTYFLQVQNEKRQTSVKKIIKR